jgi:hypothetical protein
VRLRSAVAVALGLAGCGTVVPMQTASVVDPGALRVGGSASAGYCDFGPPTFPCNIFPDGIPLPALRVDGRRGVGHRSDVGASLQLQGMLLAPERPVQLGVTVDGKRELARRGAHLLSGGLLLGGGVAGRLGLAPWLQTEVGVPLFYGLQTTRHEYVASVWAAYRALFPSVGGAQHLATVNSVRYGVALGAFRRAPAGWGFQVGYDTDSDPFAGGALQARFGWFWDLPARGQPR